MKVSELIKALQAMPQDAQVLHLWDGEARTSMLHVWLSKGGRVITADEQMVCYSDDDRPVGAPTPEQVSYWQTPAVEDPDL